MIARQTMPHSLATAANRLWTSRDGDMRLTGTSPSRWRRSIIATAIAVWAVALAGCESVSSVPVEPPAPHPPPMVLALLHGEIEMSSHKTLQSLEPCQPMSAADGQEIWLWS